MMRKRPANLPARPQPRIIVGFDSEWVADGPRNKMLSYQMVVLNADTGKMSRELFPARRQNEPAAKRPRMAARPRLAASHRRPRHHRPIPTS